MSRPQIRLTDLTLFGNDAAEDEEDNVFSSYVLEREELSDFLDASQKIRIARAYKGEGKSALLRLARAKLPPRTQGEVITIAATGASLSPNLATIDSDQWVTSWKEQILRLIAREIGATLGIALNDDAISLVEEAEKTSSRKRNVISSLLDRFKSRTIETIKPGIANPEKLLQRWLPGKQQVWLFVDDVDQNFENTSRNRIKVASFFIACRAVAMLVPELRVRGVVRPNVWTSVKYYFEALSHLEQYIVDLTWSDQSIRQLLSQRVEAYLQRTQQTEHLTPSALRIDAYPREESLIRYVFEAPMRWGEWHRPPHVILATLSQKRPRWVIELCKVAAAKAAKTDKYRLISLDDIVTNLPAFGRKRIGDTVAEFRAQCPEVQELIMAFAQQAERYKTADLISTITKRVLQGVHPQIAGVAGEATPLDVAAFLFQIGFLSARRDHDDGSYTHLTFSDEPALLRTRTNIDQGVSWEIHPVFRQALELRDPSIPKRGRR